MLQELQNEFRLVRTRFAVRWTLAAPSLQLCPAVIAELLICLYFLAAVGGTVVFMPLFITVSAAARMDGFGPAIHQVLRRLRLSRMIAVDWLRALIATVAILVLTVAVIAGTQIVFLAEERGMQPVPVRSLGEAVTLLREGKVDAVVHDTLLLRYHLKNNPDSRLALAPQTFEIFTYGITYPKGSSWREKLDLLLVKALEDGTYEEMHARWFGVRE